MITSGVNAQSYVATRVSYDSIKNTPVTKFFIVDSTTGISRRVWYWVTVWEHLVMYDGQRVRLLTYNNLNVHTVLNPKSGHNEDRFSITATVELL